MHMEVPFQGDFYEFENRNQRNFSGRTEKLGTSQGENKKRHSKNFLLVLELSVLKMMLRDWLSLKNCVGIFALRVKRHAMQVMVSL